MELAATENAAQRLGLPPPSAGQARATTPKDLEAWGPLGADAVHQAVTVEAGALPFVTLDDVDAELVSLVLDQVTDLVQNVGRGAPLRHSAPQAWS